MDSNVYEVNLAERLVRYRFLYPLTYHFFKDNIALSDSTEADIVLPGIAFDEAKSKMPPETVNPYIEYRLLSKYSSLYLLAYNSCLYHAMSFIFKGKAWLLTAPSGTGKSTQYQNWIKSYPDEITMISGDMPVLKIRDAGKITVHPSPWNGKEGYRSLNSAELGGIIYLEQSDHNSLEPFPVNEALCRLFKQYIGYADTKDQIQELIRFSNVLFSSVPVWLFKNTGSNESTVLLRKHLLDSFMKEERVE